MSLLSHRDRCQYLAESNLFKLQATRQDLQSCVDGSWEEHTQTVEDLLRYQLSQHRLVRVSSAADKNFVLAFTLQRIQFILEKILFQLALKAADGKFHRTKSLLMELTSNVIWEHSFNWQWHGHTRCVWYVSCMNPVRKMHNFSTWFLSNLGLCKNSATWIKKNDLTHLCRKFLAASLSSGTQNWIFC